MEVQHLFPLTTILLLGAFHGVNPGMGWLFAVALGMQERRLGAVWRALIPLTLGHALAIAATVLVAVAAGAALPVASEASCRSTLRGVGVYRLIRHRHFSGGGMGRNGRLTTWSFLMATCHGAGLMVLPVFLGIPLRFTAEAATRRERCERRDGRGATVVHGAGYLIVTAAVAGSVHQIGVGILRRAWFNLDLIWAIALIGTGILTVAA
jgi:hypothetical protein